MKKKSDGVVKAEITTKAVSIIIPLYMLSLNKTETKSMVPNIPPASVVLWFSPRGGWISSRVNRHGCREEAGLLGVELVIGYSSLFLFIAGFMVMCTTV